MVTERVGIFGGTFNPVHWGHIGIARAAAGRLGLDRMLWMPACLPPHKEPTDLAGSKDRVAMIEAAMDGEPGWEVSRLELDRGGRSYMIDTLRELHRRATSAGAEFYLIVGGDSLAEFPTWREAAEVARLAHVVPVARPGHGREGIRVVADALGEDVARGMDARYLSGPLLDISATEVRRRVREGESLDGWVPSAVAQEIRRRGLYGAVPPVEGP